MTWQAPSARPYVAGDRLYIAQAFEARGILEGLERFGFLLQR